MRKHLSHYTDLKSATLIFRFEEKPYFKFSKIINQNDMQEKLLAKKYQEDYFSLHTSSFCLIKEYFPMYRIYGTKTENTNLNSKEEKLLHLPVMIYFTFKEGMDCDSLFLGDVKGQRIRYCKQREFNDYIRNHKVISDDDIGFIKSNYWKYEKEFRFVSKEEKSLINFDALDEIYIYYFPDDDLLKEYRTYHNMSYEIRKLFKGIQEFRNRNIPFHIGRSELCKVVNNSINKIEK